MPIPVKSTFRQYLHERIADRILEGIRIQKFRGGARIKPMRELTDEYGVSYLTIHKAIQILKQRGILESRGSAGMFIKGNLESSGSRANLIGNSFDAQNSGIRTIAVVHPVWTSEAHPNHYGQMAMQRILNGVLAEFDPQGWRVEMIYSAPPDEAGLVPFVNKITQRNVDGVLWLRPNLGHRMNMMRLVDNGVEVVGFGRRFAELPVTILSEDYHQGARLILDWMRKKGCKRFGLLSSHMDGRIGDPYAKEIFDVYAKECRDFGFAFGEDQVYQGFGLSDRDRQTLMLEFFERVKPDGLVCLFNPLFETISKLLVDHPRLLNKGTVFADLAADYRPLKQQTSSSLDIANLHYPLESLGRQLAWHFINKWVPDAKAPTIQAKPKLEKPQEA